MPLTWGRFCPLAYVVTYVSLFSSLDKNNFGKCMFVNVCDSSITYCDCKYCACFWCTPYLAICCLIAILLLYYYCYYYLFFIGTCKIPIYLGSV